MTTIAYWYGLRHDEQMSQAWATVIGAIIGVAAGVAGALVTGRLQARESKKAADLQARKDEKAHFAARVQQMQDIENAGEMYKEAVRNYRSGAWGRRGMGFGTLAGVVLMSGWLQGRSSSPQRRALLIFGDLVNAASAHGVLDRMLDKTTSRYLELLLPAYQRLMAAVASLDSPNDEIERLVKELRVAANTLADKALLPNNAWRDAYISALSAFETASIRYRSQ
jgi:hypothetical protein